MSKEKITINAVHESDLEGFMKKLGLWDDYKAGKLKCICGKAITEENLAAFKPIDGKPYALCSIICATSDHHNTISAKIDKSFCPDHADGKHNFVQCDEWPATCTCGRQQNEL